MEKPTAIYEHNGAGWWVVSVPEIPYAHSQGRILERVMNLRRGCRPPAENKGASERDEVEPRHRLGRPLVILQRTPKPRRPREILSHHPPPRQHHEAALGLLVGMAFE